MFQSRLCLGFLLVISLSYTIESKCSRGCDLALGSYYVWRDSNLTLIAKVTNNEIPNIMSYNPQIPNQNSVQQDTRLNIPFTCECVNGEFLGHMFDYTVSSDDTYDRIAKKYYSNLTTADWVQRFNEYGPNTIPDANAHLNVMVNCSCGDRSVSKGYGLFITYPLRSNESLKTVAAETNLSLDLLQKYNPGTNVSAGDKIVYIPGKGKNGNYPPLKSSSGLSTGLIVGVSIAGLVGVLIFTVGIYIGFYKRRNMKPNELLQRPDHVRDAFASGSASEKPTDATSVHPASPRLAGVTVDKSVEFSFEELAKATDNFSLANKIGQGGFGAVYYAELRGEKAAIKKMDMQASREFLAELKVLTHVHHLNLVRLIGYCVEGSLFLVYEFIENGNLSEHLHKPDMDSLPWTTRVQIALDSARGLEYIHEHTVPVYIHRDIKSANILIDKNFHAKVADFGLTKLTEVGSTSMLTRLVGTFGYMPPEYAQYGDVSPKVDVYAFGVVMYELISAKEAIVKPTGSMTESKGLVGLFDEVLRQPDPQKDLHKLIDPRLGDTCPLDAVRKMAMLAKACTQENPQLRPSMRSIVVALMTLASTTEDWDVDSFYKNQALVNLMSGR